MAAAVASAVLLTACDGPEQYSAIKVMVLVHPDGTGELSWQVPEVGVSGERMAEYGRQYASALGLPEPVMSADGGPATLTGLPADHVDVEFGRLMELFESQWPDHADSVFVSLCTPHASGSASGEGIQLVHDDACALYVVDGPGDVPDPSGRARITFESRWHPAVWQGLWLLLAFAAGIVAFVFVRRRRDDRRRKIAIFAAAVAPMACVWIAFRAAGAAGREDVGLDTGLDFDRNFNGAFSMVMLGGFTAALMLLIGYFLYRPRSTNPTPADAGGESPTPPGQ